jgi:hypothetical protein
MHETKAPTMSQWVGQRQRPTQFASNKNAPSLDYPSKINETHQKGYVAPLLIEESDNAPCDNIDTCLVCGAKIPPGPDFCGECEAKLIGSGVDVPQAT